jgi:hypothetical protein
MYASQVNKSEIRKKSIEALKRKIITCSAGVGCEPLVHPIGDVALSYS